MSNLTLLTVFGGSLSIAESETATRELATVGSSLERVSKGVMDNITIAGSLLRVQNEHGENSEIYKNFLNAVTEHCVGWDDKYFRTRVRSAYHGYQHLPGTEDDKQFIWKLKPSLSAMALIQSVPDQRLYDFVKELKKLDKFPTADTVRRFAEYKTGSLTPKQKTQKSEPQSFSSTPQSNFNTQTTSYQYSPQVSQPVPSTGDTTVFETTSEVVESEVVTNESVSDDISLVQSVDNSTSTEESLSRQIFDLVLKVDELAKQKPHLDPGCEISLRQLKHSVHLLATGEILRR